MRARPGVVRESELASETRGPSAVLSPWRVSRAASVSHRTSVPERSRARAPLLAKGSERRALAESDVATRESDVGASRARTGVT